MIDIRNLSQGSDWLLEFPFSLDGIAVGAAAAIQFDMFTGDTIVLSKNLCNGVSIEPGLIRVPLFSQETVELAGYYDCELWIIPITEPNKKHQIDSGQIHFTKTKSRISVCQ